VSVCTTGTCPHGKDSFIWLGDGPWLGDPADPDYGRYAWVHASPVGPAQLEVCDLMPFATPAKAGEDCKGCGHGSSRHEWPQGPIGHGEDRSPGRCLDCGCGRMRYAGRTVPPCEAPEAVAVRHEVPRPAVRQPAAAPGRSVQLALFGGAG